MLSNATSETKARVASAKRGVQLSPCRVTRRKLRQGGSQPAHSQARAPHSLSQPVFGASVTFFMNA
jgi:hypothetical protein